MTIAWSWFNKEKEMDPTTRFAGLTTAWLLFVVLLEGWLAPVAADPGLTTRVSVDSAGTQANSESADAALSADGRFVAFVSFAPNLVGGDTNDTCDIFVHDRRTGTTTCVGPGISPALSANGRFVAFESEASNLVAGDTNGVSDIFVHDRMRRR
jgi:Tol biopolymer transport system component